MISPLWLWPIWLVSILLLCLFGGSTALRALLVLLPLLLAASAAVSCLASRRISLRLSSRELAPKRRGVSAELSVKNDSPFPLMQLRCRMTLENRLTGEQFTRLVAVSLPPFSSRQVSLSIGSRHCGQILLSTGRVRAADFFGLISFPVAAKGRAITTVLPNTFPLRLLTGFLNLSLEESEEYDPARAGEDVSEVHQIREYREGDALRQIHWKLTTKYDNLMIREPGRPIKRSLLLLFDLRRPAGSSPHPGLLRRRRRSGGFPLAGAARRGDRPYRRVGDGRRSDRTADGAEHRRPDNVAAGRPLGTWRTNSRHRAGGGAFPCARIFPHLRGLRRPPALPASRGPADDRPLLHRPSQGEGRCSQRHPDLVSSEDLSRRARESHSLIRKEGHGHEAVLPGAVSAQAPRQFPA